MSDTEGIDVYIALLQDEIAEREAADYGRTRRGTTAS
jgi:dihydroxyacetone kinase